MEDFRVAVKKVFFHEANRKRRITGRLLTRKKAQLPRRPSHGRSRLHKLFEKVATLLLRCNNSFPSRRCCISLTMSNAPILHSRILMHS
jgi:hypothetical protein